MLNCVYTLPRYCSDLGVLVIKFSTFDAHAIKLFWIFNFELTVSKSCECLTTFVTIFVINEFVSIYY